MHIYSQTRFLNSEYSLFLLPFESQKTAPSSSSRVSSSNRSQAVPPSTIGSEREDVMGEFPDSEDKFPDNDIFMEIDEEALISSAATGTGTTLPASSVSTGTTVLTGTSRSNSESDVQFTEEIEDFEDDPAFTNPPSSSSARTYRLPDLHSVTATANTVLGRTGIAGRDRDWEVPKSSTETDYERPTFNSTQTRPIFVPPPVVPKNVNYDNFQKFKS